MLVFGRKILKHSRFSKCLLDPVTRQFVCNKIFTTHPAIKVKSSIVKVFRKKFQSTAYLFAKTFWIPSVLQVIFLTTADKNSSKDQQKVKEVIKQADEFYEIQQYEKIYSLLYEHRNSDSEDILWRLGRALFKESQTAVEKNRKVQLVEEGLHYVEQALKLNDNNGFCHKWYGILLESVSRFKGTKEKIAHGLEIYNHFKRAAELIPHDPNAHYLVGHWCYTVASLTWYERKLAAVIYGNPPTSTFEEALLHLEKAETVKPSFYSMNLLLLGKCYMKMNNKEKSVFYLEKARDYPCRTNEDREVQREAQQLLKKLKL